MRPPNDDASTIPPQCTSKPKLSSCQLLVLQLLHRGYSAGQIAQFVKPSISVQEVEDSWQQAAALLGATNLEEVVEKALRRRLIV
jgi:DNA-binding NarL/FixJ family response regulator